MDFRGPATRELSKYGRQKITIFESFICVKTISNFYEEIHKIDGDIK